MKMTRKCATCGIEYSYCSNGARDRHQMWKNAFHSESCKDIFKALTDYNAGTIDAAAVVAVLESYGITDYSVYKESIAEQLEKIVAEANAAATAAASKSKAKTVATETEAE